MFCRQRSSLGDGRRLWLGRTNDFLVASRSIDLISVATLFVSRAESFSSRQQRTIKIDNRAKMSPDDVRANERTVVLKKSRHPKQRAETTDRFSTRLIAFRIRKDKSSRRKKHRRSVESRSDRSINCFFESIARMKLAPVCSPFENGNGWTGPRSVDVDPAESDPMGISWKLIDLGAGLCRPTFLLVFFVEKNIFVAESGVERTNLLSTNWRARQKLLLFECRKSRSPKSKERERERRPSIVCAIDIDWLEESWLANRHEVIN